jgi:drug/metabolite transporter (DMT)-like permease
MPTEARPRPPGLRYLAGGACGMALVGGSVGVSRTLATAPLFAAQAIRYVVAAGILLALARSGRVKVVAPRGREWLWLAGIAATGLVLFNIAVVRGVAHAEPAVIAVAVACVPVLLAVIGPMLERQAPGRRILVAAAAVTAGSALVAGTGRTDAVGLAWAVVALFCEASFTLLAVPVLPRHGAWGVSLHSVWIGAAMFVVLGAVTEGPGAVAALTAADWAAIAYLAVLVTAVAFIVWYSAVSALGAGRAGLLTGIAPVSAAVTGIMLGAGAPAPSVWIGMLVVISGLAAGLRPGSRRAGAALADRDAVHEDHRYLVGNLGRRLTARLAPGGLERQVERADERQEQDVRADAGTDCAPAASPLDQVVELAERVVPAGQPAAVTAVAVVFVGRRPGTEQHRVVDGDPGDGPQEAGQRLDRVARPVPGLAQHSRQVVERLAEDGIDERLAGRVAAVHRGPGDLRGLGDPLHASRGILGEQPAGGTQDPLLVPPGVGP